jgi:hypothetical protein
VGLSGCGCRYGVVAEPQATADGKTPPQVMLPTGCVVPYSADQNFHQFLTISGEKSGSGQKNDIRLHEVFRSIHD